jgi:hypothetical protein
LRGNVPVVGSIIGVRATASTGGIFNVDPGTLTAVSQVDADNWNLSYALTHANVTSAADGGEAVVLPLEVPETLVVGASIPLALTFDTAESDGSRCVSVSCFFATIPTTCTVVLQIADRNRDNRFYTVGTVAQVTGSAVVQSGGQFQFVIGRFMRLAVTALTGSGTVIGTIFV